MTDIYTTDYEPETEILTFYVNLKEFISWVVAPDHVDDVVSDFELIFSKGVEYGKAMSNIQ